MAPTELKRRYQEYTNEFGEEVWIVEDGVLCAYSVEYPEDGMYRLVDFGEDPDSVKRAELVAMMYNCLSDLI